MASKIDNDTRSKAEWKALINRNRNVEKQTEIQMEKWKMGAKLALANTDEDLFASADADASKTFPKQCSTLRKGDYVILKEKVCKIVEMNVSKPGKHGHAKVRLVGLEIFTNKKVDDLCPASQNMNVPIVTKKEYQLVSISFDDFATLLDLEMYQLRSDLKLPDNEIKDQLKSIVSTDSFDIMCTVLSAMGDEKIVSFKELAEN